MRICDLLTPADVLTRLRASSKARLIALMSERAAVATGLPAQDIADQLLKREQLGSTGVGGGLAIPHARIDGLARPQGVLALPANPVDFESVDGQSVDLVFLLLMPADQPKAQLPALARIARLLRDASVRATLRSAETGAKAYAALCEAAKEYPIAH